MFFGAARVRTGVAPESVSTVTECASGVEIATAAEPVAGVGDRLDVKLSLVVLYRMFRSLSSALSSSCHYLPLARWEPRRGARPLPLVPSAGHHRLDALHTLFLSSNGTSGWASAYISGAPAATKAQHLPVLHGRTRDREALRLTASMAQRACCPRPSGLQSPEGGFARNRWNCSAVRQGTSPRSTRARVCRS